MVTVPLADFVLGVLVIILLLTLHYVVHKRRLELQEKISRLESLGASIGLLLLESLKLLRDCHPDVQARVAELEEGTHKLFRTYREGGIMLQALGDITIDGDVMGQDKKTNG